MAEGVRCPQGAEHTQSISIRHRSMDRVPGSETQVSEGWGIFCRPDPKACKWEDTEKSTPGMGP